MTRTLYKETRVSPTGESVTVTVVRTDDYETCEIAHENKHYPCFPLPVMASAYATSVIVDNVPDTELTLAWARQNDAFIAAIREFARHGIILN